MLAEPAQSLQQILLDGHSGNSIGVLSPNLDTGAGEARQGRRKGGGGKERAGKGKEFCAGCVKVQSPAAETERAAGSQNFIAKQDPAH